MLLADLVNAIGITAYTLLLFLLLWVSQIPGANRAGNYWLSAVICILVARFVLQFLPSILPLAIVQVLYSSLLVLEKYALIMGLFTHAQWQACVEKYQYKGLAICVAFILVLFILNYLLKMGDAYATVFALSQAIAIGGIALIVWRIYSNDRPISTVAIVALLAFFVLHWLSFPIALKYPLWLSIGFVAGNFYNIIIYIYLVYIELLGFQLRLQKSEHEAKALAGRAIAASEAKSQFLANMSHELRTPMNAVLGMLRLLQRSDLEQRHRKKVDVAFHSGKALLAIINDILDFSKVELGGLTLESIETDTHGMLEGIVSKVKPLAEDKGLTITLEANGLLGHRVVTDPVRLRQVIMNLVANALKFTEFGSILIQAHLEGEGDEQTFYCSVTDTGIGFDDNDAETMFEAFQQADTSSTRQYGGTGLGLSIARNLCRLLGGNISARSVKGEGSCFTIWIKAPAVS